MKTIVIIPLALVCLFAVACKSEKSGSSAVKETTTTLAAKPYPLTTCLVSGEKLGEMGQPIELIHNGQQLKFCCEKCVPKFQKDSAKYLAHLK